MAKASERRRTVYFCRECGHESARWMGFCPSPLCGSPRPLAEGAPAPAVSAAKAQRNAWLVSETNEATELSELSPDSQPRITLPSQELNRVLGGGVVPGSVTLLTGEPGVGKSTLLLQLANSLARTSPSGSGPAMYVTGEESPMQVKLRSQRLGIEGRGILLLAETDVDAILEKLDDAQPALAIIDSIQTLHSESETSGPGSVGQVRESGLKLMRWAKARGTPVFISGHMTKDGALAGPRVLEHMVDVVLHLESQESGGYRVLRAAKNRFGSTDEAGVLPDDGTGSGGCARPLTSVAVTAGRIPAGSDRDACTGGDPGASAGGAGSDQLLSAAGAAAGGQRGGLQPADHADGSSNPACGPGAGGPRRDRQRGRRFPGH